MTQDYEFSAHHQLPGHHEDIGQWLHAMSAAWGSSLAIAMTQSCPPCIDKVDEWGVRAIPMGWRPGHGRRFADVWFWARLRGSGGEVSLQVMQ